MANTLRLVTWNACNGFRTKLPHVEELGPDIAVLQEVRLECLTHVGLGTPKSCWLGDYEKKGVAAIGYNGWVLTPLEMGGLKPWFLPFYADKGDIRVNLVAAWAMKPYVPPTLSSLELLREHLSAPLAIFAGDLNQSVKFDVQYKRPPGLRFEDVRCLLEVYGLTSAWHTARKQAHGQETEWTYYHHRKEYKPFHIDYAFNSAKLRAVETEVGAYGRYVASGMSDHVPLTVNYVLEESRAFSVRA